MSYPLILFTLDYPPEIGGVARFLGNIVKASEGKMRVVVPCTHAVTGPGHVTERRFFWNFWPKWFPSIGLIRREAKGHIALVSHVFPLGTAAWMASWFGGPRYAVLFHGLDLKLATGWWKRWLLRRIVGSAQSLIVNSRATAIELEQLAPGLNPLVMTPGVDLPVLPDRNQTRKRFGIDPDEIILLSVCRSVSRKNVDGVIRALSILQNPRLHLVVIGDGPERMAWEQLAIKRSTRVTFLSTISDAELAAWYAASDLFILPVISQPQDMEGFGIVYLEAAAAGLPVIAGRDGGTAEAVIHQETGLLVDGTQTEQISEAIETLINDADLRYRFGQAGKKRVEMDFQWKNRWEELSNALHIPGSRRADVSIVIPVFNHAPELRETLRSICAQTVHPREVIVVDDASSDDVASVVGEFRSAGLGLQLIRLDRNSGAPVARNTGFDRSTGEYVLFLDADVTLDSRMIERSIQAFADHPEADFVYGNFWWGSKLFRGRVFDPIAIQKRNWIHTSSMLRRSAFPGFDPKLQKFQDWDLWWTMAERGSIGVLIEEILFSVTPRRRGVGISDWLPGFVYRIPWPIFGWMPQPIRKYRKAERIVREKHRKR